MKVLLIILLMGFSCANRALYYQRAQDIIDKQNAKEGATWTAGHNKFSYMSLDEKKQYLGVSLESQELPPITLKARPGMKQLRVLQNDPPEAFDWRDEATCIGAVRDQGGCGASWAFSTTSALADRYCIGIDNPRYVQVLSPQHMLDCDTLNSGCQGGNLQFAWTFLNKTGVVIDDCYPYIGQKYYQYCYTSCPAGSSYNFGFHHAEEPYLINLGEDQSNYSRNVKLEIKNYGPITTLFMVDDDFLYYESGVYVPDTSVSTQNYLAVEVIGWGIWGKGTSGEMPYWIAKNCFGRYWGDYSGYIYIGMDQDEKVFEEIAIAAEPWTHP